MLNGSCIPSCPTSSGTFTTPLWTMGCPNVLIPQQPVPVARRRVPRYNPEGYAMRFTASGFPLRAVLNAITPGVGTSSHPDSLTHQDPESFYKEHT